MEVERQFTIDKKVIAEMPGEIFPGRITVINSDIDARKALRFLQTQKMVGIDTETRPSFRKGQHNKVALVQISTDDQAFLFRVNKFGIIEEMVNFFENGDVTKVGLSLRDDFNQMHGLCEFEPKGFVDLQNVVGDYGIIDASLQKIYAIVFSRRISKGQQLTNWEAENLTEAQCRYGATDAWACLKLIKAFESGEFDVTKCPYIL